MARTSDLFAPLARALESANERERRLLIVGVIAVVIFVFGGGAYFISRSLDEKAATVTLRQTQLDEIRALESRYREAEESEKRALQRLKTNPTSLFSLLQKAAAELGLTLNDLNERQLPVKDTDITEVSVEVNLKSLSLDKLHQFMEKVEGTQKGGLVRITKLKVKARHDAADLVDVNLTVATWKQVEKGG